MYMDVESKAFVVNSWLVFGIIVGVCLLIALCATLITICCLKGLTRQKTPGPTRIVRHPQDQQQEMGTGLGQQQQGPNNDLEQVVVPRPAEFCTPIPMSYQHQEEPYPPPFPPSSTPPYLVDGMQSQEPGWKSIQPVAQPGILITNKMDPAPPPPQCAEIKLQPAVAYAIPAANKNKSVPSLFERNQKRAGRSSSSKSSSRKYKK